MIETDNIIENLDKMIPNPICELVYQKDYELLIATVLAAQSTDKRVNLVTKEMFSRYNLHDLKEMDLKEIEKLIRPVGTYKRKALYLKEIAKSLIKEHKGHVPNDRVYLESLPGVGRKTANVVLNEIYDVPAIAVDTHVSRVSKRLKLADNLDDVLQIEQKLMQRFPKEKWGRLHKQLVLFGRYTCKSQKPDCKSCLFNKECEFKREN